VYYLGDEVRDLLIITIESRRLEVRCGIKKDKKDATERKVYVHMLNGTLCATTRAMSCIAENYQTSEVCFHLAADVIF
jgi:seryl-tRNA synthetase